MNTVYGLVDPRTELIHYIGVTKDVHQRFAAHLGFPETNEGKAEWFADLKSSGLLPSLLIIESNITNDLKHIREAYWIHHYSSEGMPLTNQRQLQTKVETTEPTGPEEQRHKKNPLNDWLNTSDAVATLTKQSGYTVSASQLRRLADTGKIAVRQVDRRTKMYSKSDTIKWGKILGGDTVKREAVRKEHDGD